MNRHLNPTGVRPGPGYSHGVEVPPGARLVQTAGQVGMDVDGVVAEGVAAQTVQTFSNLATVLADAGMGLEDVVMLRVFLTDPSAVPEYAAAAGPLLPSPPPPNTLLIVRALARPELLVEVEALAARA